MGEPKEITIRLDQDTTGIAPDSATIQELDLRVTDRASYSKVAAFVNTAKDRLKSIKEWAGFYGTAAAPGSIVLANAAHKNLTAQFAKVCAPYEGVVKTGEAAMKTFDLAERKRLMDEEAARQKALAEQEQAQKAERAAANLEAEKLRREGEISKARAVEVAASPVAAVAVGPISAPPPVAEGVSKKFPWVAEVEDIKVLLRALADEAIPLWYDLKGDGEVRPMVVVDMAVLNALAKTRQKDLGIPGCISREDVAYSRSRTR